MTVPSVGILLGETDNGVTVAKTAGTDNINPRITGTANISLFEFINCSRLRVIPCYLSELKPSFSRVNSGFMPNGQISTSRGRREALATKAWNVPEAKPANPKTYARSLVSKARFIC